MAKQKVRKAPTQYPFLAFHAVRVAQLAAALIVLSIMAYFIYNLVHDHWRIPKTFAILLVASLLTIVSLAGTFVLHCCCGLNPRVNALFNLGLFVLWFVGLGLLTWWSNRPTLSHKCNAQNWGGDDGIMICRIYKVLFAFSLTGTVSTFLALALDIYTFRKATRRGVYNQMQNIDGKGIQHAQGDGDPLRPSGTGPFALPTSFIPTGPTHPKPSSGYSIPSEQFNDDTEYRGREEARAMV